VTELRARVSYRVLTFPEATSSVTRLGASFRRDGRLIGVGIALPPTGEPI
jgi:hypothetical protein